MFGVSGLELLERIRVEASASAGSVMPSAVGSVVCTLKNTAAAPVGEMSDGELMGVATDLQRCRSLLAVSEAHVSTELENRGCTIADHGLRTAQFLAVEPQQPRSECRRRVRVAKVLKVWFPLIDEAICDGRLSWEHAELLVAVSNSRIRSGLAELQEAIIELAESTVFEHWRNHLRSLCALLDQDGGHDPKNDISANKLVMTPTEDGVFFKGELVDANAVIATEAIEKVAGELFRKFSRDKAVGGCTEIPRTEVLNALALVELCRRANATDTSKSVPGSTLASVVIETDETNTPTRDLSTTSTGQRFTASQVEELHCDARLRAVLTNSAGVPLHLGRARRLASAAQRQTIRIRDGGCVFPSCEAPPSWCVIHHVIRWRDSGSTDPENLATLCPHHHGLTHSRGWNMRAGPDQTFQWSTPQHKTLKSQRHGHIP